MKSKELSESNLSDKFVYAFCKLCRQWNFSPAGGWSEYRIEKSASNVYHPLRLYRENNADSLINVKILQIFEDTMLIHVKYFAKALSVHVSMKEYLVSGKPDGNNAEITLNSHLLCSVFNRSIFVPLIMPNQEFPALSFISAKPLLHIFSYLTVNFSTSMRLWLFILTS